MFASKYDDTEAFQHLEQVVMKLPHAKEQLEERVEQFAEARVRWEAEKKKSAV
jgi:exonuclease VII small subunit